MPPTTFIAVQCFQCSTMQVKQQKKSSNKWSCVVCNQKQSLRHVFAKGFMAKDVRKFVQNFNMSRQLSDQKQLLEEEQTETLSPSINEQKKKKKKRNDWTEYVDEKDEYCGKFNEDEKRVGGENGLEPIVVTETPKALFKKPKLKDYYSSSSSGYEDKLLKPVFQNRSNAKSHKDGQSQDILLTEFEQTPCERASKRALDICSDETPTVLNPLDRDSKWNCFREVIQENNNNIGIKESFVRRPMQRVDRAISNWSDYITQDEENYKNGSPTVPLHQIKATNGPVSKWSSFVTEEDDHYDLESKGRKESLDHVISQRRKDVFESLVTDERVEDDIHPDFL